MRRFAEKRRKESPINEKMDKRQQRKASEMSERGSKDLFQEVWRT